MEKILELYVNTEQNAELNGSYGGAWIALPMEPDELDEALENILRLMDCKDSEPHWIVEQYRWDDSDLKTYARIDTDREICVINRICTDYVELDDEDRNKCICICDQIYNELGDALNEMGSYEFYDGHTIESMAEADVENAIISRDFNWLRDYIDMEAVESNIREDYLEGPYGLLY